MFQKLPQSLIPIETKTASPEIKANEIKLLKRHLLNLISKMKTVFKNPLDPFGIHKIIMTIDQKAKWHKTSNPKRLKTSNTIRTRGWI